MTGLIEIPLIGHRFTTAYKDKNTLFNMTLPRDERVWSSANSENNTVQGMFDAFYKVERVEIDILSSDQTSWNCNWMIQINDGGFFFPLENDVNTNVGRGGENDALQFSLDNDPETYPLKDGWKAERKSRPPLRIDCKEDPYVGMAIMIEIGGHGWFWIQGLSVKGTKIRDYTLEEKAYYLNRIQNEDSPYFGV